MLRAWRDDPSVDAWLVPINPEPPRFLRRAARVKYVRTILNEALYVPLLVRELRHADVVHVFSASYFSFVLAPLPAIVVARALGRPVVVNYHSGQAADHLHRSALARRVLRSVERIVVPSEFLAGVFRSYDLDATVVPNTVDAGLFAFRERRPLRPRLLSTRNLDEPYNVACTIRAFRVIQDRWPGASLTLVGAGPHADALRRLVSALKLTNVEFAGRVESDRIHRYYADHDLYIQSPDVDNMPLSVLEAFSSGLPVVSTDAGGVPTLLHDGVHGLLAPVGDHRALAERVLRLLDAPDLARRFAAAAHETCRRYHWTAVRSQWIDVYQRAHGQLEGHPTAAVGGATS